MDETGGAGISSEEIDDLTSEIQADVAAHSAALGATGVAKEGGAVDEVEAAEAAEGKEAVAAAEAVGGVDGGVDRLRAAELQFRTTLNWAPARRQV